MSQKTIVMTSVFAAIVLVLGGLTVMPSQHQQAYGAAQSGASGASGGSGGNAAGSMCNLNTPPFTTGGGGHGCTFAGGSGQSQAGAGVAPGSGFGGGINPPGSSSCPRPPGNIFSGGSGGGGLGASSAAPGTGGCGSGGHPGGSPG